MKIKTASRAEDQVTRRGISAIAWSISKNIVQIARPTMIHVSQGVPLDVRDDSEQSIAITTLQEQQTDMLGTPSAG